MIKQFILDDELYRITTVIVFILDACRKATVWRRWTLKLIKYTFTNHTLVFVRYVFELCVTYLSSDLKGGIIPAFVLFLALSLGFPLQRFNDDSKELPNLYSINDPSYCAFFKEM